MEVFFMKFSSFSCEFLSLGLTYSRYRNLLETPTHGPAFPSGLRDGPYNVAQEKSFLTVI
jgi:hypothetical protein